MGKTRIVFLPAKSRYLLSRGDDLSVLNQGGRTVVIKRRKVPRVCALEAVGSELAQHAVWRRSRRLARNPVTLPIGDWLQAQQVLSEQPHH